jgi:hypothetical protein
MNPDTLKQIGGLTTALASRARRLSWNLSCTNDHANARTAAARVEKMKAESEPFRRMPRTEHARVQAEITKEETARRRLTASAARWGIEPLTRELQETYDRFVSECRRDVASDFPGALDNLDPAGMLMFELLKETLRPGIEQASADDLYRRYERALQTKDTRSLIEATLIEERVTRPGSALAKTEGDLPAAKRLHDFVDGAQEMRVPLEQISDVPATIEFARKQVALADLVYIKPLALDQPGNEAAKQALDAEAQEYANAVAAEAEA